MWLADSKKHQNTTRLGWYLFLIICLGAVLFTHPFLKLPYDPWEHLIKIRSIYDDGYCFLFWPENEASFWFWHWSWAKIFSLLSISDTFIWAYIIHFCQSMFALASIFYFSATFHNLCVSDSTWQREGCFAFFATLFWLIGNGTYSIELQQAWLVWYSGTYQGLTLPLFWLISGFNLRLFFASDQSRAQMVSLLALSFSGLVAILLFHPAEALYFATFFVVILIFTPKLSFQQKFFWYSGLTLFTGLIVAVGLYLDLPGMRIQFFQQEFSEILKVIRTTGESIVAHGGNRFGSSLSELAQFSLVAIFIYVLYVALFLRKLNNRLLNCLLLFTLIVFVVPINKWLAGIAGSVLHQDVIWRFFFASPWFLFLPYIFLKFCSQLCSNPRKQIITSSGFLLIVLILVVFGSEKYFNKALSGNFHSLIKSFDKKAVGLQYDDKTLRQFGDMITSAVGDLPKGKAMLYVRGDLATIARAVHGYYVYSHRRVSIPMHQFYRKKLHNNYQLVQVPVPVDFPKDRNIFLYFNLDEKKISSLKDIKISSEQEVVSHVDSADVQKGYIFIAGWAVLKGKLGGSEIFVVLESDNDRFAFDTSPKFRQNVGEFLKSTRLENSGFLATIKRKDLEPGTYKIGLLVKQDGAKGYTVSNRKVVITN